MRIKRQHIFSSLSLIAALITLTYGVLYGSPTTANSAFIKNLPAGYTSYPGELDMSKSCSCSTVGISGAPPPPPPCNTNPCNGNSFTSYGSIETNTSGITSSVCKVIEQSGLTLPPCFQLDEDDALVIVGSMSGVQNIAYFSFTLYQTLSNISQANQYSYIPTAASVNLGINKTNLKMSSNGQYVLIVTASTQTRDAIRNSFQASGIPDQIINSYFIPTSISNLGKVTYPDQLTFTLRLTPNSEQERQQVNTFIEQNAPATKVFFIKGPGTDGDITYSSLPNWEDKLRVNNVQYTTGLDQKLAALEQAVINTYTQQGYSLKATLTEAMTHVDAKSCTTNGENCAYDSPDALYNGFPCDFAPVAPKSNSCIIKIGANSNDVLMLLGVDHGLVATKNLATYFSYESKASQDGSKDGTFAFMGSSTQGSASQYVSASNATNLYAVKIGRFCGAGEPYCIAVPYLGGTPETPGFFILGRVYLDKITGTAPNPANLIPARLLWFSKA